MQFRILKIKFDIKLSHNYNTIMEDIIFEWDKNKNQIFWSFVTATELLIPK